MKTITYWGVETWQHMKDETSEDRKIRDEVWEEVQPNHQICLKCKCETKIALRDSWYYDCKCK